MSLAISCRSINCRWRSIVARSIVGRSIVAGDQLSRDQLSRTRILHTISYWNRFKKNMLWSRQRKLDISCCFYLRKIWLFRFLLMNEFSYTHKKNCWTKQNVCFDWKTLYHFFFLLLKIVFILSCKKKWIKVPVLETVFCATRFFLG